MQHLQHTASHATPCNTLQHIAAQQSTATTLQHALPGEKGDDYDPETREAFDDT